MIVELSPQQVKAIERQADWKHDRYWRAVLDSLEPWGATPNQWRVTPGADNELAEEVLDAWFEAQEEGEDNPYMTVDDEEVRTVGNEIFDHMNYGLAYGFDDDEAYDQDDLDTNAVITPYGPAYSASLDGRFVGEYATEEKAITALRKAAGPNYFPDLFWVDDHGGISLMEWD